MSGWKPDNKELTMSINRSIREDVVWTRLGRGRSVAVGRLLFTAEELRDLARCYPPPDLAYAELNELADQVDRLNGEEPPPS